MPRPRALALLAILLGLLSSIIPVHGQTPAPTWQADCFTPNTLRTVPFTGGVRAICEPASTPTPVPSTPTAPPTAQPTRTPAPTATAVPPLTPTATTPAAHPKGCPAGTIWVSIEEWWHNTDGGAGIDAGHLHAAICWPHKAVFRGKVPLQITTTLHASRSELRRIYLQVHTRTDGENPVIARADFRPWRAIATCVATGGTLQQQHAGPTCTWSDTITLDVNDLQSSGWKQLRIHAVVRAEDGHKGQTSSGLHFYADNGNVRRDTDSLGGNPNWIEGRGWWDESFYTNARLLNPPIAPVSGRWCPRIELVRGSGISQPIASYRVAIDANYHEEQLGQTVVAGRGEYRGSPCIDTTTLPNGWHVLDLRTDAAVNQTLSAAQSGKLVIYFEVRN